MGQRVLHLLLLLTACGPADPQPAATTPGAPTPQGSDLLGDPGLYAAKGAPTLTEQWSGPWFAWVHPPAEHAEGAQALATALGVPTHPWTGSLPSPGRGELAVIWLEPGAQAPAAVAKNMHGAGAIVAVLAPGDPAWTAQLSSQLPWLGIDVVDVAASAALWADPILAEQVPAVAGGVAALVLAQHFALPYSPPQLPPTDVPGLAQHLVPQPAAHLEDPRARAAATQADPDPTLLADHEVAVRLALATSTLDQAVLAQLAKDPEPLVRARAADRSSSIPALSELCWDPSSVVRVVATHALARMAQQGQRGPEIQQALDEVARRSPDAYQRWKAAFGLGWLPGQVPTLSAMLGDPDVDVRREAASSLGRQRDPKAVAALIDALDDPNSFMRSTTVRALAGINDPQVIPALERAAADPSLLVAVEASIALQRQGRKTLTQHYIPPHPPTDREGLVALLQSSDPTIRKDACKFVAGRDDAATLLRDAVTDSDPEVRKSAVQALGAAPGSTDLILPLLEDPDPDVVVTTLESLRRIGGFSRDAIEPLLTHPDAEQRLRAAEALASLGPHPSLEALGDDPDERIRAAWAQAYPDRVKASDPSLLVRRAAAAAHPERWRDDPSAMVTVLSDTPPDAHGAYWALGVLAREDDLLHLRFSFNDETKVPRSHLALRPPVVREYGHPNRG